MGLTRAGYSHYLILVVKAKWVGSVCRSIAEHIGECDSNEACSPRPEPAPTPEPEIESLDEVRCPECGAEDEIERTDQPQCPPDHSGRCTTCGHTDHPLAFHACWKHERMTDGEREQARAAYERYASRMADYQASAAYLSEQREP